MLKQIRTSIARGCEALGLGVLNTDVKDAGGKVAGFLGGLFVVEQSIQPAHATAADYATTAATQIATIQTGFDTVYAAAFGVMLTIVIAMVVWKYGKKLGLKV